MNMKAVLSKETEFPTARRMQGISLMLALALSGWAAAAATPVYVSFQEGDVRTGTGREAVTTNGTLVTSSYNMGATYVRSDQATTAKDNNQLIEGTQSSGTKHHTLLSFDVSYLTNLVGNDFSRIDSVALILTHDTNAGNGGTFVSSVYLTRAFNETNATWNNPHGDSLDVGGFIGTELRERNTLPTRLTPSNETWASPGWFWPDGGNAGPDLLVQAVRGVFANATPTLNLLIKRTSESAADNFCRIKQDGDTNVNYRPELLIGIDSITNPPVLISVTATLNAAEPNTNGQFTITRSGDTNSDVDVFFYFTGTATENVDYTDSAYVHIPAGITSVNTAINVIDDNLAEGAETVTMNLLSFDGSGYSLWSPTNATINLYDDLDGMPANMLAAYYFNENSNAAPTLSAVAVATVMNSNALAFNAVGGAGIAPFGVNNGTDNHGYGTSYYVSAPSCLYFRAVITTNDLADAITAQDYVSFTLAPKPGFTLSLSGVAASVRLQASNIYSATWVVRSSQDNFTTDLATKSAIGNATNWDTLTNALSVPAFTNLTGPVEFRIYLYSATQLASDFLRIDDVYFFGTTGALPPGLQQVYVTTTDATASEPGTDTGTFVLSRVGDVSAPLTVYYAMSGTASNGVDYQFLSGVTNFAAGSSNVTLVVTPIDDVILEPTETATLTILTNAAYLVGAPNSGTVSIADDDAQTLTVAATIATASETGPVNGEFTFYRTGNTNHAVTVFYSMSGTAANGLDYNLLSGFTTFPAGVTNLALPVIIIDDAISETNETAIITLSNLPAAYLLGTPSNATVNIVNDNDPPMFTVNATDDTAFERVPQLGATFTISRSGGLTNAPATVNFTWGGTATNGIDYIASATNSITFLATQWSRTITLSPSNHVGYHGDKTVLLALTPDASYAIGPFTSATATIVDDELPPETVLWSDNFDAGTSATNWSLVFGANNGIIDYSADFAFDYSKAGIPPAPGSTNTIGLKVTVNKDTNISSAALNLYPVGQTFTGDYALRFNLFIDSDNTANPTEHILAGLNHASFMTNRVCQDTVSSNVTAGDGIFAALAGSGNDVANLAMYTTTNATLPPARVGIRAMTATTAILNSPPYFAAGSPGNNYNSSTKTWVDVEIGQVGNLITWKLNNSVILQYTNTTAFTNGDVMIGYNDQYGSIGSTNNYAIIDNVRVVRLGVTITTPHIAHIQVVGGNVLIDFTGGVADATGAFSVIGCATATGTYAPVGASITTQGPGAFRATIPLSGSSGFYRIAR